MLGALTSRRQAGRCAWLEEANTVVGCMEPMQALHDFDEHSEDELTRSLMCAMAKSQEAQDGRPVPPTGKKSIEEREAYRRRVAEEHNASLGVCTDEELAEVCVKEGQPIEGLKGVDAHGVPWVDRAMDVLKRHRKAFAKDPKKPPVTHHFDVEIDTGSAEPIADKARRWTEREAHFIMEHIAQLRERRQIQPSHGPWASNPVLVVPNGKVRFCVDYRKVNKATKRDEHGLGNMEDML